MLGAAETAAMGVCPAGNHEAAKPVTADLAAVEDAPTREEAPTIGSRGAEAPTTTVVVVVADSPGINRVGAATGRTGAVVVNAVAIVVAGRTGAVVVNAVAIVVAGRTGAVRVGAATGRTEAAGVNAAVIVAADRTEAVDAAAILEGDIPPMPRATIPAAIRLAAATSQPAVVAMSGASNRGVDKDDLVDATPRISRRALRAGTEGNGRTPLLPGASPLFWNWTSTTAGA